MTLAHGAGVDVVVVTYNSRAHFTRLRTTLEAQTHPFRLFVVDNASRADDRPTAADMPAGAEIVQMESNSGLRWRTMSRRAEATRHSSRY